MAFGVVVVTFNHRVGIEGLDHTDGAPANRGLLDQVAAPEWCTTTSARSAGTPEPVVAPYPEVESRWIWREHRFAPVQPGR